MIALRPLRQVDFCAAAGYGSIDRFHDKPNMRPQTWPLLPVENYDRDFATGKILLIAHVLVGRQQHVEAVSLCSYEQFAILEPVPALLRSRPDLMSFEIRANGYRRRLIK